MGFGREWWSYSLLDTVQGKMLHQHEVPSLPRLRMLSFLLCLFLLLLLLLSSSSLYNSSHHRTLAESLEFVQRISHILLTDV